MCPNFQITAFTVPPRSNVSISRLTPLVLDTLADMENSESVMLDSPKEETLDRDLQIEPMEADGEDNEGILMANESFHVVANSFSVPSFVRKVYAAESGGDDLDRDHKLIVIAVHTVMLESGFVPFDEKANVVDDGFQLGNEWPLGPFNFKMSLFYTLPEIVRSGESESTKCFVLNFQRLGKFMNVYGTLGNGLAHWMQFNEYKVVPFLNVVWAKCGIMSHVDGEYYSNGSPEEEVFNFWRDVKDHLVLPLLTDLCEESGWEIPPCFMRLPDVLKLKIMESLPGVDVAKVGSVCSELRCLASCDELWKMKFCEEFSKEIKKKDDKVSWRNAFSVSWSKRHGRVNRVRAFPLRPVTYLVPPEPKKIRYIIDPQTPRPTPPS